ncbi:hypothetical protein TNCV_4586881 [Trichonephila clavipes]|nr:hypothetical protein TNCV_4586881 [Trichonephila clavipes]
MISKDILECVQSSKSIIDADSDGENASPVLKSSEMRNTMKNQIVNCPERRAVFNFHGTLGTSNCCALFHYFQSTLSPPPSVLTLPVMVREGFSLNFLLNEESFHYPSPMDPPCPGLATGSRKERE